MKIVVIGAGGVGGYFGGMLAATGVDVTLVARGAHLQSIQQHGLRIEHPHGQQSKVELKTQDSTAASEAAATDVDLVIVSVKGSQLEEAGELIHQLYNPGAMVLSLIHI